MSRLTLVPVALALVLSYLGIAVAAPPPAVNNPFGAGRPGLGTTAPPPAVNNPFGAGRPGRPGLAGQVLGQGGKPGPTAQPGIKPLPGKFDVLAEAVRPNGGVLQPVPVPSVEDTIVYRAQFKVRTADRGDANQDDGVKIRLNGMNETWLDTARDDFERGDTRTYDLMLVGTSGITVGKLRDIQMLEISKPGSDGWCFSDIELIVNNVSVYKQTFPQGHWLDNGGGSQPSLTISGSRLRSHPSWRAYRFPTPSPVIPREEIESRLESALGHFLHGKKVIPGKMYGRSGVEASYKDAQTLHVDLDLEAVINNFPNQEVDVDFDVVFTTNGSQVQVALQNLKVDLPGKLASALLAVNGVLGGTSKAELTRHIERQVMRQLQGGRFNIPTSGYSVSVIVGGNGNLVILPKKL